MTYPCGQTRPTATRAQPLAAKQSLIMRNHPAKARSDLSSRNLCPSTNTLIRGCTPRTRASARCTPYSRTSAEESESENRNTIRRNQDVVTVATVTRGVRMRESLIADRLKKEFWHR